MSAPQSETEKRLREELETNKKKAMDPFGLADTYGHLSQEEIQKIRLDDEQKKTADEEEKAKSRPKP